MKIKQDFITNSSSSSFIVVIPHKFNIEKYINIMKKNKLFTHIKPEKELLFYIIEAFKDLKNDRIIYEEEFRDFNEVFYEIVNIILMNNFDIININNIITESSFIANITDKKIDKITKLIKG